MSAWAGFWIGWGLMASAMVVADAMKWCVRMMSRSDGKIIDSVTFTWKDTEATTDGK